VIRTGKEVSLISDYYEAVFFHVFICAERCAGTKFGPSSGEDMRRRRLIDVEHEKGGIHTTKKI
jgi:hypothetical protein